METSLDFIRWLSKKLYEVNIGFFVTVGLIMVIPYLFTLTGLPPFAARFIAFFIVCFIRAAYESVIVYETPIKKLSLPKMLLLTFITASSLSLVAHFLRPQLGNLSIFVSFLISMVVVGKVKAALWPATQRPGFIALLPAKLKRLTWARYGFFLALVGITVIAYGKLGINFALAFATAYFVGMLFEEFYSITKIYEQYITPKFAILTVLWSALCAIAAAALVILLDYLGCSGQVATITSVIIVKLIQPLGERAVLLRATNF